MCMCCMFILQGHIGGLTWCSRDRFTGIASLVTFICSHASPMKAACCLVFHIREVHMSHAHSMLAVFVDVSHAIAEVHFPTRHYLADAFRCYHWTRAMSKQAAFVFICLYTLSVHQLRLVAVIIGDVGMSQDMLVTRHFGLCIQCDSTSLMLPSDWVATSSPQALFGQ